MARRRAGERGAGLSAARAGGLDVSHATADGRRVILRIENVNKTFEKQRVLKDLNLEIGDGEFRLCSAPPAAARLRPSILSPVCCRPIRAHLAPRSARQRIAAAAPWAGHGVPVLGPVPPHERVREHRLWPPDAARRGRRHQAQGRRYARSSPAAWDRAQISIAAVRRNAAARGPCARPRHRARSAPPRRAALEPGRRAAQGDAGRAQAHPRAAEGVDPARYAQPGGGAGDVRPHRCDEVGPDPAHRHAPGDLFRSEEPLRLHLSRRSQRLRGNRGSDRSGGRGAEDWKIANSRPPPPRTGGAVGRR